jgi:hypothetical protein
MWWTSQFDIAGIEHSGLSASRTETDVEFSRHGDPGDGFG